jgi:putative Ca2+/H+ antiporter (TMEM165/GDT1 family)
VSGACVNILGPGHGAGSYGRFGETFGIGCLHPGSGAGSRAKDRFVLDPDGSVPVETFLVSAMVVGLAEIGDKTQILSLMLAARFQRPVPILFGILFATLANHVAAGLAGTVFGSLLAGPWMRWILGLSFLSVAVWALFPDKYEGDIKTISRRGAFISTLIAFFFAEIGDKTQIATVGLAARFEVFYAVVAGTTLGMVLANIPAVILGDRLADKLPVKAIRISAALLFGLLGVLTLSRMRL